MKRHACALLAALAASLLPAAAAQAPDTVKVGKEIKKTVATVTELQAGDVACYLTLKDDQGTEFTELGDFSICEKRSLLGKRVKRLFFEEGSAAEPDPKSPLACLSARYVQNDRLALGNRHALDDSGTQAIAVRLRILAAEQRVGCVFVEHFKIQQALPGCRFNIDHHRQLARPGKE